ncbi:NAD-dependent epimerase/dehydratase family protein [Kitasatospora sp. NPDC002227]|uniref:NAD-dependent epimerase/dehydratase family protein n=1 Tax=Kitasatospora sp. NPDC002227 TaxID=3154773 RepID=UPI00332A494C
MDILFLGGSKFLGRAYVSQALRLGHRVTTFNRGASGADLPGAEAVRGDRTSAEDLARLVEGRRWDAVVDTSGQQPYDLGLAARVLRPHVGHYSFVSSIHAFADWGKVPLDEGSVLHDCPADTPPDQPMGNHLKAGCERALLAEFGAERSLILNCGLLVGPYESLGRLLWWLERIGQGGQVVAPGQPGRGIQLIDARDFAAFGLDLVERAEAGRYLTTAPVDSATMGELIDACVRATGSGAEPVWVDDSALLAAGVAPWTELPFWLPELPDFTAIYRGDTSRAVAAGLRCRPLAETVRDTWAWLAERGPSSEPYLQGTLPIGLPAEKEQVLLEAHG